MDKEYFKKVINIIIGFIVLLGIPYLAGSWLWLIVSWFPALFTMMYLEE